MTLADLTRHTVDSNTVGLWQFNGDMTDSSGNGYDLALETGTERYTDIWPRVQGALFDGSSNFYRASITPALQIAGDLTIEFFLLHFHLWPYSSDQVFFAHYGSGESLPTNYLYQFATVSSDCFQWFHEYGAGANVNYLFSDEGVPTPRTLTHVAVTRRTNVIRIYLNGQLRGTSTTLTAAEDGSAGLLRIGNTCTSIISSFKLCNVGMTDAEIAAEYNATFGPVFGEI